MQILTNIENFTVFNILEYLQDNGIGEADLNQLLSDFSCPINPDVERFLKQSAIEFTKKNQSVTYLVFSNDAALVGYFSIALKPITVNAANFSNTMKQKIARVSEWNEEIGTFGLSAYLIAQLGKNFTDDANLKISGQQLLEVAMTKIYELQYLASGMVVFLETENSEKLFHFYDTVNGFKAFETREWKYHTLIKNIAKFYYIDAISAGRYNKNGDKDGY